MKDSSERNRLLALDRQISSLRNPGQDDDGKPHPVNQAHLAWRMVIDLVAGVGVGAAVGYGLDYLLGTLPVMMAIFTLLGLAAGVNLMLRTAKEVDISGSINSGNLTENGRPDIGREERE